MTVVIVDSSDLKMEYSINSMILLSYVIPKNSKLRNTRKFKKLLPRKKTSSRRIGKNFQWNLLEEAYTKKHYHFINLDFNNEINDNVVNETRENISKYNIKHLMRKTEPQNHFESGFQNGLHYNKITGSSPLTPPMTPQVGHDGFEFNIKPNTVLHTPESEIEGLPLTPIESEVFAY